MTKIRSLRFINHILHCYRDRKIEINPELLLVLKFVIFNFIEEDNNELRGKSVEPLFLLSSFDNENSNLYFNKVLLLAEDSDMRVRATVAKILICNEDYKIKFDGIISSLAQDNYYYIRQLVSKSE